jgi:hypothetical protein
MITILFLLFMLVLPIGSYRAFRYKIKDLHIRFNGQQLDFQFEIEIDLSLDGHFHWDWLQQANEEGLHQIVQAHFQRQGSRKEGIEKGFLE